MSFAIALKGRSGGDTHFSLNPNKPVHAVSVRDERRARTNGIAFFSQTPRRLAIKHSWIQNVTTEYPLRGWGCDSLEIWKIRPLQVSICCRTYCFYVCVHNLPLGFLRHKAISALFSPSIWLCFFTAYSGIK